GEQVRMPVAAANSKARCGPGHTGVLHARRLRITDSRKNKDVWDEIAADVWKRRDLELRDRTGLLRPPSFHKRFGCRYLGLLSHWGKVELRIENQIIAHAQHNLIEDSRSKPRRIDPHSIGSGIEQRNPIGSDGVCTALSRRSFFYQQGGNGGILDNGAAWVPY